MLKGTTTIDHGAVRYRFGTAEFDPQLHELRVAGRPIEVQRKPLEILAQLLAHAGTVVTREQLLDSVWNGRPVVDNVIASAITKLRGALGHDNAASLITHPRVGYRWCGIVKSIVGSTRVAAGADLESGMPIPYRFDFSLHTKLVSASHNEVWSARHNATGNLRAYKFSRTTEGLNALKREAALLQILQQTLGERTHVVRALDWNFEHSPFFIGYQFAGVNLAEWASSNDTLSSASRSKRLDVFLKIAAAVGAAHEAGVVHQDLKPANIMISADAQSGWQVRLTDFGSGRLMQSEHLARLRITQFGLVSADALTTCSSSATALYVAPELLAGHPASEQSDIYALGVLLYQMLVADLHRPIAQGWERQIDDELLREDIACAIDCDPTRRFACVAQMRERIEMLEERRVAREVARREAQATIADRERHLLRQARRGWMIATLILSGVVLAQAALMAYDWVNSK